MFFQHDVSKERGVSSSELAHSITYPVHNMWAILYVGLLWQQSSSYRFVTFDLHSIYYTIFKMYMVTNYRFYFICRYILSSPSESISGSVLVIEVSKLVHYQDVTWKYQFIFYSTNNNLITSHQQFSVSLNFITFLFIATNIINKPSLKVMFAQKERSRGNKAWFWPKNTNFFI